MTLNQLMTVGAIGFAGFALWHVTRKPAGDAVVQPAQRSRDAGLANWFDTLASQEAAISNNALTQYVNELKGMNIL
jgi:hypothetical protein